MRGHIGTLERYGNSRARDLEGLKEQTDKYFQEKAEENPTKVRTGDETKSVIDNVLNQEASNISIPQKPTSVRFKKSTTEGLLYFIAVDSLHRLEIQFVPDISVARRPLIAGLYVIGRNTPKYHYLGGETLINLKLDFHAAQENRQDVIDKCRWLEHLTFNDGYSQPPQKVKLVFGDLFRDELWIVKSINYNLSNFHKQYGFLPQQAFANIQLALDPESNLVWEDIRSDGGKSFLKT